MPKYRFRVSTPNHILIRTPCIYELHTSIVSLLNRSSIDDGCLLLWVWLNYLPFRGGKWRTAGLLQHRHRVCRPTLGLASISIRDIKLNRLLLYVCWCRHSSVLCLWVGVLEQRYDWSIPSLEYTIHDHGWRYGMFLFWTWPFVSLSFYLSISKVIK